MRDWAVVGPAVPPWAEEIAAFLYEHADDLNWQLETEALARADEVAASAVSHRLSAVAFSRVLAPGQEMKVIGVAVIERQRRGHVGVLRIVVHRDWRSQGIGRALLREVLMHADARGIHRVEATPYRSLTNSRATAIKHRLFESEGFELEGIMRKGAVVRNEFVDVAMMARVKGD